MNIFNLVGDKFFAPLHSKDQKVNYELLIKIYQIFDYNIDVIQLDKDNLISTLVDFLKNNNFNEIYDEDGNHIEQKNERDIVLEKLRYFKNHGWISEGDDIQTRSTYVLEDYSAQILKSLNDIANKDTNTLEYSGYIYLIYTALTTIDNEISQSYNVLSQIEENAKKLNIELRGVNIAIKRYLTNLTNRKDISASQILQTLLGEYQQNVISKSFYNLKLRYNPSIYINYIMGKLETLLFPDKLDEIVFSYCKINDKSYSDNNVKDEAKDKIKEKIISIQKYIDSLEELILLIATKVFVLLHMFQDVSIMKF